MVANFDVIQQALGLSSGQQIGRLLTHDLGDMRHQHMHGFDQGIAGIARLLPAQVGEWHGIIRRRRVQNFIDVSHRLAVTDQDQFFGHDPCIVLCTELPAMSTKTL